MSTGHHDREFFEHMATCRGAYRRLADAIHVVLGFHRVLDIGAGLGFVAGRLAELGWDATACDPYAPEGLKDCACKWRCWKSHLDERWLPGPTYDVVICTETAEHIDASAGDTIVANVAGTARTHIVWSAAQPGQEWPGHVNLQPPSYWLERFARLGWSDWSTATKKLRSEMLERHAQHEYAADNFFVLEKRP